MHIQISFHNEFSFHNEYYAQKYYAHIFVKMRVRCSVCSGVVLLCRLIEEKKIRGKMRARSINITARDGLASCVPGEERGCSFFAMPAR